MPRDRFGRLLKSAYQHTLVSRRLAGLHTFLFRVAACGLGLLNYEDSFVSGEDHLIRWVLPKIVRRPVSVFLDVGANAGRFSTALADQFPQATIHAFEPHPENAERLRHLGLPGLRVHPVALGAAGGRALLYDRADRSGSQHASLHREVISKLHRQSVVGIEVVLTTLDAWASENGISHIDFMKLDVEGSELDVLRGSAELLKGGAIDILLFEFNEMNTISRCFLGDFQSTLVDFSLYRLLPRGMLPLPESTLLRELFAYQNILAVRSTEGWPS
jgi:FkbM family methyltransferase